MSAVWELVHGCYPSHHRDPEHSPDYSRPEGGLLAQRPAQNEKPLDPLAKGFSSCHVGAAGFELRLDNRESEAIQRTMKAASRLDYAVVGRTEGPGRTLDAEST